MGAAVAVILAKEKEIVDAFRRTGALDPGSSVSPTSIGVADRVAFRALQRREVLREATPGSFYLDEQSWSALRGMRRRMGLALLLAVLLGALLLWMRR